MKTKLALKLVKGSAGLLLLLTLNLQLSTLFAQPTMVDYQGQLDVSGNPANGSYDMTFTFYVGATGGTPLAGPITVNPVAVNNGLFTLYLTVSPGIFDFGVAGAHFLEVAVRPSGSTAAYTILTPRQMLAQTPYSVAAQTAGRGSGGPSPFGDESRKYTARRHGPGCIS